MKWLSCLLVLLYAATPAISLAVESHAVIFMYSRIGVSKYPDTNVSIKQFTAHLDYLEKNKYQVWPLEKIVNHLKNGLAIPDRTVAITFDDGHISVVKHAYPRLKKRGWPFTVFIYTDAMDQHPKRYITWDQMREMRQHGASFANQSRTHGHLIRRRKNETAAAWTARVRADIEHAQRRIEEELGPYPQGTPRLFSYPYGEYNLALATLVAESGYVGIGEQSGPAGQYSDLRVLPRYPISEGHDSVKEFAAKASSLPLPVTEVTPWEPLLKKSRPPRMIVTVAVAPGIAASRNTCTSCTAASDVRLDQLVCQASGQGRIKVQWLDKESARFAVEAPQPLRLGRSRYNCSAPSAKEPGRHYWFSHLWIRNAEEVTDKPKPLQ